MSQTLIKNATILTLDAAIGDLQGDLLVDGGKIAQIGRGIVAPNADHCRRAPRDIRRNTEDAHQGLVCGTRQYQFHRCVERFNLHATPPCSFYWSKKLRIFRLRLGCLSLRSAFASIWRMRSRVTLNCWPTSSRV